MDAPWFEPTCARKREDVGNEFFHEGKVLHLTVVSGVFLQQDLISSGAITWCSGYQLMLISSNLLIKCSWSWSFFSSLEFLQLLKCRPQKQQTLPRWLSGDFMACFVEKPKGPRSVPRWCRGAKKESNGNGSHMIQAVLPFRHGCHPSMPSCGDLWSDSLPLFSKVAERPCPFLRSSCVRPKARVLDMDVPKNLL